MINAHIKEKALGLIQSLLDDEVLTPQDLKRFVPETADPADVEYVRQEMERWYRTLGIESITGQKFMLARPPFTCEEMAEAYKNQEIILCVPRGVTPQQLGTLFNMSSWALSDELVSNIVEEEDFWFKTKCSMVPDFLNRTGVEVQKTFENEGLLGMSLSRYMAFVARMRHLTGQTPDVKHWVWLTRGRYDRKGMLVAGFDSNEKFSVHGWLPQFHGKYCGARYVSIPDHL